MLTHLGPNPDRSHPQGRSQQESGGIMLKFVNLQSPLFTKSQNFRVERNLWRLKVQPLFFPRAYSSTRVTPNNKSGHHFKSVAAASFCHREHSQRHPNHQGPGFDGFPAGPSHVGAHFWASQIFYLEWKQQNPLNKHNSLLWLSWGFF